MIQETEYRLQESVQATLNSSGTGNAVNVGPRAANERWVIDKFSASGTAVAKLQIFRGNSFANTNQIDVTVRADNDTSETDVPLLNGEVISFLWTNGQNNAVMSCRIEGKRFVKGRRAY